MIAIDPGDFPTDRYVVEGIAAADGREVRAGFDQLDDVAVVLRSMIDYRTAEIVDIAAETARITAAGALVIWDLSHAAGVHPVGLREAGAQLAVGCTYKFLNGGPGSPAFGYVARELIDRIDNPIQGWFSQHDQFAMEQRLHAARRHRPAAARHAEHHRPHRRPMRDRGHRRGGDRRNPRQVDRARPVRPRVLRCARLAHQRTTRRRTARRPHLRPRARRPRLTRRLFRSARCSPTTATPT